MTDAEAGSIFPDPQHDHHACVASGLAAADAACASRGERLSRRRRGVLEVLLTTHRALGAYDILGHLAQGGERVAPTQVYRALDFLREAGLAHRVESLNAYVACAHMGEEHTRQLLICRACGQVAELADSGVEDAVARLTEPLDFQPEAAIVEIAGTCGPCRSVPAP